MRVHDLLRKADLTLDEGDVYVDRTTGAFDVEPMFLPATNAGDAEAATPIHVASFSALAAPSYSTADEIENMDWTGADLVVLLAREESPDLGVPRLLKWLDDNDFEVAAVATLSYRWFSTGIVLKRPVEELFRVRSELRLRSEAQKVLTRRIRIAEQQRVRAQRAVSGQLSSVAKETSAAGVAARRAANLAEQVERQNETIDGLMATVAHLREETWRLEQVEQSTSYRLGRLLTSSAKPGRGTLSLPREVRALWHDRGAWKQRADFESSSRPETSHRHEHRDASLQWVFRDDPPLIEPSSAVAMIASSKTDRGASRWGNCRTLFPNDAQAVFASEEFSLLIIDSGAGSPGEPWTTLGQPMSAHLEETVLAVIEQARTRNIRTAFWWTCEPSAAPRLVELAGQCDHQLVAPGASSVAPAHHLAQPTTIDGFDVPRVPMPGVAVFSGSNLSDVEPPVRTVHVGAGRAPHDWVHAPNVHRVLATASHAVLPQIPGRATELDRTLTATALACGLVTIAGHSGVDPDLDPWCLISSRRKDVQSALESAPAPDTRRDAIIAGHASLWQSAAWPAAVGALFAELDLPETAWSAMRDYSILVSETDRSDRTPAQLSAALQPPPNAVVADHPIETRERNELAAMDVAVLATPTTRFVVNDAIAASGSTVVAATLACTIGRRLSHAGEVIAADLWAPPNTTPLPWWLEGFVE